MTSMDHNYCFWENWEKFSKNLSDFWGGDGLSNRFFERLPTFPNFLRLASDRTGFALQFTPYDDLGIDWYNKKITELRKNYDEIVNFVTKNIFF